MVPGPSHVGGSSAPQQPQHSNTRSPELNKVINKVKSVIANKPSPIKSR